MKDKKYLSFELNRKSLKFVEIEGSSQGGFKVVYYKDMAIPMLTLPGGEKTKEMVVDWDILLKQLKGEIKERNYSNSLISLTVPSKDASDTVLTIPLIKGRDIVQFLEREIKKTTVIQDDKNNKVEYLKLGDRAVKSGKVQDILTVLTDKDKLNDYLSNFGSLGVRPHIFTIKAYALYSLVMNLYPELDDIVLVDVGSELTSMIIVKDGQLRFARSMYVTIGNIVDVVSQENRVSEKEIEEFINQHGFKFNAYPETDQAGKYKKSILRFMDKFRAELQRSILFYQEKFSSGGKVSKMVLTGAGLGVADVADVLRERLRLEIDILSPSAKIVADDEFKNRYSLFASCIGSALIPELKSSFNLAPKAERDRAGKRLHFEIAAVFCLVYATIYFLYLGYTKEVSVQKKRLNQIEFEIEGYPDDLEKRYQELLVEKKDFSDLEEIFLELQRPHIKWEDFFSEISNLINPDMLVIDFWVGFDSEGSMVFQVKGSYESTYPDAQLTLRKVRLSFEESKLFENVKFEIQRAGEVKIGEVRSFPYIIAGYINPDYSVKRQL